MLTRLWTYHCGRAAVPRALVEGGQPWECVDFPLLGALVEHPRHGPVPIDAPLGRDGLRAAGTAVAGIMGLLGFDFQSDWGTAGRLREVGFAPGDVDHTVFTHLHVDHTGGMAGLSDSRLHVARREWDIANHSPPLRARTEGYVPPIYEQFHDRVDLFDRPDHFQEDPDGLDLFGDGSIRAVSLPGHTRHHVGYRLNFADGDAYLHVGDAAFTVPQITDDRSLGPMVRHFAADVGRARSTLSSLRTFETRNEEISFLSSHDVGLAERCRDGPVLLHDAS